MGKISSTSRKVLLKDWLALFLIGQKQNTLSKAFNAVSQSEFQCYPNAEKWVLSFHITSMMK